MVRDRAYHDARQSSLETAQSGATLASRDVASNLKSLTDAVAQTAATPGIAKAFVDATGCSLTFAGTSGFATGRFEIVSPGGAVVCSSRPVTAAPAYAGASWLDRAKPGPTLLAPVRDPVSGVWTVLSVAPIAGGGFIAGSLDLAGLGTSLASRFGGSQRPEFLVLTADGRRVLARSIAPSTWVGRALPPEDAAAIDAPPGARPDLDGRSRLYGSAVVSGVGWRVQVGEDELAATGAAATRFHRDLLAIAIGLLLVLGATFFVYRRVAQPIRALSRSVRSAAFEHAQDTLADATSIDAAPSLTGAPAARETVDVSGPTEVAGLARDFNDLIVIVDRELAARRESESHLLRSLAQLEATDSQRRRLLSSLVTAQEEERRRIASDVHDDSIQVMAAMAMRIGMIRDRHDADPDLDEQLQRLQENCEQAIYRLRHLLFQLRPPSLDRAGLVAALDEYLQQWTDEAGLTFQLHDQLESEPPPDTRAVIFRIAQEALTNVRKHARASQVTVTIEDRHPGVLLRVVDDGQGFTDEKRSASGFDHFGLSSMRDRADVAGGWCQIESDGEHGTRVEAWIPMSSDPAAV